jgi:hypothetical protein
MNFSVLHTIGWEKLSYRIIDEVGGADKNLDILGTQNDYA